MCSSFTPYVVTFLHCVVSADPKSLRLLRSVLTTLEEIAMFYERSKRQYSLCKALYRIAEELVEARGGHESTGIAPSNKRANLPLQLTATENWDLFDTVVEDWDAQYVYSQSLTLDASLD